MMVWAMTMAAGVTIALLALAAICLIVGVVRGSFRVWVAGYVLLVAGLVVVYATIRSTHRGVPAAQEAPASGARS